ARCQLDLLLCRTIFQTMEGLHEIFSRRHRQLALLGAIEVFPASGNTIQRTDWSKEFPLLLLHRDASHEWLVSSLLYHQQTNGSCGLSKVQMGYSQSMFFASIQITYDERCSVVAVVRINEPPAIR